MEKEQMLDLVSMGDLMIDFSCAGKNDEGRLLFERNPGGAPMNVAAQLSRLGGKAGVICCLGRDEHGEYLYDLAKNELGFDVTNAQFTEKVGTRFLFVYFDQDKERSFTNYKGSRSDLMIEASELDLSQIRRCKVFNYTPLSFEFDYPIAKAAELALAEAHSAGVMTAFDSNYRFPYEDMKVYHAVQDAIYSAQILKLSQDDIRYFMKEENVFSACEKLLAGNAKIVAFTMGTSGSLLYTHKGWSYRPAYRVNALDTTGAGDSFMGALIYLLTHETDNIEELSVLDLERIGDFCNACAAASTMMRGSLLVMPTLSQIEHVLKTAPRIETQFDKIHKTF